MEPYIKTSHKIKSSKREKENNYEAKKSYKLWMRDHNVFGIDEREGDGFGLMPAHTYTHTNQDENNSALRTRT